MVLWQHLFFIFKPSKSKCSCAIEYVIVESDYSYVVLSTNYNLFHPLVLAMEEGCKNALKQALALVNNNGQSKMYMLNEIVQEVFHKW
jgi:hypothetical protein